MKVKSDLIDIINNLSHVFYQIENKDIIIIKSKNSSYSIKICFWKKEHTVFFENWHWHFTNNDEENHYMIETIVGILKNNSRIKEKLVNNKIKASILEFKNDDGTWDSKLKTEIVSLTFWRKKKNYKLSV